MSGERQTLRYALIASACLVSVARGMTLSFLAIKLQQTFGLGPAMIGFLLGLGPLIGATASPFAGAISDRIGRKAVLTLTLCAMALAMVGMGLSQTVLMFCLAQAVSAVAISIYGPISRALMSDICPEPVRLKYFSWRYTASNAGWAVGPLIGLAAGVASAAVFFVAAFLYASIALALHLLRLPPLKHFDDRHFTKTISLIASARSALSDPRLIYFAIGGTLLIAVYGQWHATLAPYLADNVTNGVKIFAYLASINGLIVLIGNPVARRFVERVGPLKSIVAGCAFFVLGQLGFMASTGLAGFAISMVVFTAGEILVVSSEYMLVDGISNARNRGSYFGAHAFSNVGSFLGPTVGGLTLGALGGPAMFVLFAAFAAVGAFFFAAGTRIPPSRADAGSPNEPLRTETKRATSTDMSSQMAQAPLRA